MQQKLVKYFLGKEWLLLVIFFSYLLNLFGLGAYLKAGVVVAILIRISPELVKLFDSNFRILLIYLLLYLFFLHYNDIIETKTVLSQISVILIPTSFYLLGKLFAIRYPYKNVFYFFVIFIAISISVIPFISNLVDIISNGFMNNRNISLIWANTEGGLKNATNVGSLFTFNMVLFGVIFIPSKNRIEKGLKKYFILLFLMGLISIMNMSVRTGVFLSVLSLSSIFLTKKKFKGLLSLTILLFTLTFMLYVFNVFDWIENSFFYSRFTVESLSTNYDQAGSFPRLFRWGGVISGLFDHPLGGKQTFILGNYAHNLWLDVGWSVGVLPLIFLIALTYKFVKSVYKIILSSSYDGYLKALVYSVSIGFIFSFMVEPIMEGYILNFSLWCFFLGYFFVLEKRNMIL